MEIWKDIVEYEGLYQVSNFGRVRSLDRYVNHYRGGKKIVKSKILEQDCSGNSGYKRVQLCKDGKQKHFSVHRLVAIAFLPNPDHLPFVNHKDENKANNHVDNLEWCTHEYNDNYGTRNIRMSETKKKPIIQYDKQGNFIREWKSATDACIELKICKSSIYGVCAGRKKSAGGYKWQFKTDGSQQTDQ